MSKQRFLSIGTKTAAGLVGTAVFLLCSHSAHACPDVDGLVDTNCDGKVEIVCFGDSITAGTGDTDRRGGYPGRLKSVYFPNAVIRNSGDPGERTVNGKSRAARVTFQRYTAPDFSVVLEGVNDYFEKGHTAKKTYSNIGVIARTARSTGAYTFTSTLTDVRRSYQKPWVRSVNKLVKPGAGIDFFSLGDSIVGSDSLHPNGRGYDRMAALAAAAIQSASERQRPADLDGDGIYDFAEPRFGANPAVVDTDGDGLTDGEEVFTYHSSPNSLDSDGDGLPDYYEAKVLLSDPSRATPSAPTIQDLAVVTQ